MSKTGFDHDALVEQFAQASAKQGEALRQAVQQATLKALQGRELTLKSVRDAVSGIVRAPDGTPVEGAIVTIERVSDDEGGFGGRREERLADDRCRGAADEGRRGHGRRAGQGG